MIEESAGWKEIGYEEEPTTQELLEQIPNSNADIFDQLLKKILDLIYSGHNSIILKGD